MEILQFLSLPFLLGTIWGVFQYFRNRKYKLADERRQLLATTFTKLNEASNRLQFDIIKIQSQISRGMMKVEKLHLKNIDELKEIGIDLDETHKNIKLSDGEYVKVLDHGKRLKELLQNILSEKKETVDSIIEITSDLRQKIEHLNAIPLYTIPVTYNPKIDITELTIEVEELINGFVTSTYFKNDFTLNKIVFEKLKIISRLTIEIESKIYIGFK